MAALPLAVVLTAQQFLHTSPGLFGWARITTGLWALLYILLSLDPAIRDKVEAAREIAGILHTIPAASNPGGQQQPHTTQ